MRARFLFAVFKVSTLVSMGACASSPPSEAAAPEAEKELAPTAVDAAAPIAAATAALPALPAQTCAPIDEAKIRATACDDAILTTPIPEIVDEQQSLGTFFEAYARLARGRAGAAESPRTRRRNLRVAMYGDSNLTMDELTGRLRRELQQRFGDGGHGFVGLALPWHWYEHQDVHHHGTWDHFRQIATSTAPIGDRHYGIANIASESTSRGASVWVSTASAGAPIGVTASRFDVYFLKRPAGGDFDLSVDGSLVRSVSTKSDSTKVGVEHVDLPDAPHKLTCTVKSARPVRFFGATLERDAGEHGSIVIDSLGASALNFSQLKFTKPDTRRPMFQRRDYKLVIFQVGTNTFATETHKEDAKRFLAEIREALPDVSVLFMTPPDVMKDWNDAHSDARIVKVGRQLREIAAETGSAFWDYREAMGGDTSIRTFIRKGLATADKIHMKKEGSELMADRFLCALEKDFRAWLAEHPTAGCEKTVADPRAP